MFCKQRYFCNNTYAFEVFLLFSFEFLLFKSVASKARATLPNYKIMLNSELFFRFLDVFWPIVVTFSMLRAPRTIT